jgi:hypothetical protein
MVLSLAVFLPGREVAKFTIVAIVGHEHLWANKKNLAIVDDNSAVIDDVFVYDRPKKGQESRTQCCSTLTHSHANVAYNALSLLRLQYFAEHFP